MDAEVAKSALWMFLFEPEETGLVLFLASEQVRYITEVAIGFNGVACSYSLQKAKYRIQIS